MNLLVPVTSPRTKFSIHAELIPRPILGHSTALGVTNSNVRTPDLGLCFGPVEEFQVILDSGDRPLWPPAQELKAHCAGAWAKVASPLTVAHGDSLEIRMSEIGTCIPWFK